MILLFAVARPRGRNQGVVGTYPIADTIQSVPSVMNPHPLIRIDTNFSFNDRCDAGSVNCQILFMIAGAQNFDCWPAMKNIFSPRALPGGKSGKDHGVCGQSQSRDGKCSASQLYKEGDKNAFLGKCIEVCVPPPRFCLRPVFSRCYNRVSFFLKPE